jgi:crotonobetainyl-CoA:carnitine CoA-transferase CaiB-like acyl-CoA transferase
MLAPYRVLDLADDKGFYCGQLLGSLGADVIKIEKPGGDPGRKIGPFFHDIPDPERSLFWLALNSNKKGITLDIQSDKGKDIFKKLVKTVDIVVESFPPGHMDSLGLGYTELDKINPEVIVTSISPFGQTGPYRDYQASDLVCWAMGGLLNLSGDPDRPPVRMSHIPLAFLMGGMDAAWGTVIALFWRGKSGKGQQVDVSLQETMAKTIHVSKERRGSSFYDIPQAGVGLQVVWQVEDGYIYIMLHDGELGMRENPALVRWMDDAGMADNFIKGISWDGFHWRDKSQEEIDRIQDNFARFFRTRTKEQIIEEARSRHIVIQPINSPRDVLGHPQLAARNYWQNLEHVELGASICYPSRFCLPSETDCKLWRRAPLIGEHNQEIYQKELGLSDKDFAALKQERVI